MQNYIILLASVRFSTQIFFRFVSRYFEELAPAQIFTNAFPYMKKLHCLVFLSFSFVLSPSFSQQFSNQNIVLIDYKLQISNEIQPLLLSAANLQKSDYEKLVTSLTQVVYEIISSSLQKEKKVFILPSNSFEERAKLDIYGFPHLSVQKAISLSNEMYFLKISVKLYAIVSKNKEGDLSYSPYLQTELFFYNKFGYLPVFVTEDKSGETAPLSLPAKGSFLSGVYTGIPEAQDDHSLLTLLRNCLEEAFLKMK